MPRPSLGTVSSAPGFAAGHGRRAVETWLVDGVAQAGSWDLDTGDRRVLTSHPDGVSFSEIEPDGGFIWWFDAAGDDAGSWRRQPFPVAGDASPPEQGSSELAFLGVPPGRPLGVAFDAAGTLAAVCAGTGDRSRCFAGPPGGTAAEVYAARGYRCLADVAPDGSLLALAGAPGGPDAVVLCDPRTGATTVLAGDPGRRLWPLEFRPGLVRAPELLLMVETGAGFAVATWSAGAGLVGRPHLTFPTTASAGWYPGGDRVLVQQEAAGRSRLLIADLDLPEVRELLVPDGTIHDLSCAPDGSVHCLWSRAGAPAAPLVINPAQAGAAPVDPGPEAPATGLWTPAPYGDIHSLIATPEGDPPWPVVFLVHGGPATHDRDCADPRVDALTGAGYVVVRANYRGSTGYGPAWQHDYGRRVGLAQAQDLAAVRAHLLERGLASAELPITLLGYSWGGYLALLAMGVQPELWSAAVAVYPIADYARCFATTTPALRELDIALFGGTPDDCPDRYAAASPITYAAQTRGPVLVIGALGDERCPPGQIRGYLDALRARRVPCELAWRDGSHTAIRQAEQESVMSLALGFLRRHRGQPAQFLGAAASRPATDIQRGGIT